MYKVLTILEDVSITTVSFIDDYCPFDFATKGKVDHSKVSGMMNLMTKFTDIVDYNTSYNIQCCLEYFVST
jgi:hypothetical protein